MICRLKRLIPHVIISVAIIVMLELFGFRSFELYQAKRPVQFSSLRKAVKSRPFQNASSPLQDGDCSGGIRAFTYATNRGNFFFCDSLESALQNRVPLNILGWGEKWDGFLQKLHASLEAVEQLPSSCTVLFVDSYDVLFTQGLAEIKERFQRMDVRILFSAECGCWPFVHRDHRICRDKYPKSPTLYKYLNYGGWIARQEDAVRLLRETVEIADQEKAAGNDVDDQEIVAKLYIAGGSGITLDHYSQIFQTLHYTRNIGEGTCNPWPHLVAYDGLWHNEYTGSQPVILHFNGGGKKRLRTMRNMLWYRYKQYRSLNATTKRIFPKPLTSAQLNTVRLTTGNHSSFIYREACSSNLFDLARKRFG